MIQAHVEVIHRRNKEFQILPKPWVVERTFAWFNQYHRLSKDLLYKWSLNRDRKTN